MSGTSIDLKEPEAWESAVRRAVANLRFGSVEVLVHDGRVVQVETREKVRFTDRRPPDTRRRTTQDDAGADREPGGPVPAANEEKE
jgi:hypothetical protein